jgi:molybdate transport system permease protein
MIGAAELEALLLSLQVALLAVAMSLPLAILAGWALARFDFPGKIVLDGLIHIPLVVPAVVVGYLLLITMGTQGPIGGFLDRVLGIQLIFSFAGAAIAAAVMSFPLMVRAIRLSVEAINPDLEAAARTLGASGFDVFRSITFPLMAPGVLSGAVVAYAASLGEFGATITFVANIPGETRTLPLAIYTAVQSPGGDAMALRLAVLSLTLAMAGLIASELLARRLRAMTGT